jgi:hypothetical protein
MITKAQAMNGSLGNLTTMVSLLNLIVTLWGCTSGRNREAIMLALRGLPIASQ